MFCPNCGRENPNDARFCSGCGVAHAPGLVTEGQAPTPSRSVKLRRLHTFDWEGECPACGLVHTSDTTRCPNDNSPLVVALNVAPWVLLFLPIHTAELRCVRDCGYLAHHIPCNNGDSVIKGKYIRFGFPAWRIAVLNLSILGWMILGFLMCSFLVAPFFAENPDFVRYMPNFMLSYLAAIKSGKSMGAAILFFASLAFGPMLLGKSLIRFRPYKTVFDFNDVEGNKL